MVCVYRSEAVAVYVWLETEIDGYFSDNGLLVSPNSYDVTFYSRVTTTADELKSNLKIYSLYEAGGFGGSL